MRSAALALALLGGCATSREGWASRGRYEVLLESPTLQIRRGGTRVDPATGEAVIAWVGARAVEGTARLVACDLVVFEDEDGDGRAGSEEIRLLREVREETSKILFDDVRARGDAAKLRARVVARTSRERQAVTWRIEPD